MNDHKNCLHCGHILRGRPDKKYCDDHCRSSYHNLQNAETSRVMRITNHILRRNRRILEYLCPQAEVKKLPIGNLLDHGFNLRYFTHTIEFTKGIRFQACYDYSYRIIHENMVVIRKSKNANQLLWVR